MASQRLDVEIEPSEQIGQLSPPRSGAGTPGGKGKKRVGFNVRPEGEILPGDERSPPLESENASRNSSVSTAPVYDEPTPGASTTSLDGLQLTRSLNRLKDDSTPTVLRSALRKGMSGRENKPEPLDLKGIPDLSAKLAAESHARARATGVERDVASAPGSRTSSPHGPRNRFQVGEGQPPVPSPGLQGRQTGVWNNLFHKGGIGTGQNTPDAEELEEYFPEPQKYRAGGLSAHLLSTFWGGGSGSGGHSRSSSVGADSAPSSPGTTTPSLHITPPENDVTPPSSVRSKPFSWGRNSKRPEYGIHNLVSATASSTALGGSDISSEYRKQAAKRPEHLRSLSSTSLVDLWSQPRKRKKSSQVDITIKKHIQETQARKKYILKLCRALMEYGAPTHRLEAYLSMTSRVLEIEAQFLYFPGTMLISFDDTRTHTAEMKLVRVNQGVDLGKMKDTHNVYKDVSHDLIGVEEGIKRLEEISKKGNKYPIWLRILAFGFGSAFVGPFAFEARPIDMPIAFLLGLILGTLQLVVAPKSDLYASVFEIVATIITSFLSRAFGSINGGRLFCFSTLAQSSIAIILPGFTVLSAALELQSRSIVAGSVRIVYAIVYSLWIGYGLTIGTAIYGAIDKNASNESTCHNPLADNPHKYTFLFIPAYTICLAVINQAKWRQMPMMTLISFAGYQVNYWAGTKFQGNTQIASTLGAAAIGVLANGYSRAGRRIDEYGARVENWAERNIKKRIMGSTYEKNSARPQQQRRKSSVADSFLNLLPEPLRPHRPQAKDVEGSPGSSEEDEPKPDNVSQATTAAEPGDNGTGASSGPTSPTTDTPNEKPAGANDDANESDSNRNARGVRIGRDGKPKHVNYVLAAAAMLPAIFVQVPSGVSVAGSLVSGIEAANQLTQNSNASNSGIVSAADVTDSNGNITANISFTVAASVVQVAIGITIGLFIGSIIVYPTGKGGTIGQGKKSRSGLFAF